MAVTTKAISDVLKNQNGRWRAADTEVSKLTDADRKRMLGAIPSGEAMALSAAPAAAFPAAPAFALSVDWRNKNGNHITPVANQGGCGACVSFGCSALIESMAHIESGIWIDLSEADSHFCSSHGANCNGWWPDQCLDEAKARGISDDACFPYASAFPGGNIWGGPPACAPCGDRNARAVKIGSRHQLVDPTSVKNHLTSIGPVVGCFSVYDDFFNYSGGVYHHVSGNLAGGHCVLIVGYSEAEQCWLIKNSWDVTWGVGGFGKIAYADMLFNGSFFPMYGATGVALPATGFKSLSGQLTTQPVFGHNKDGRLEVFARGTDNALWHIWQTAPNNGWSGWASLGGGMVSDPCVVSNADGRMEVFVRGTDGALWHRWQTAPNNGWSGWASLSGVITSNPTASINADGRLEVFARGADGSLWHIWQNGPQQGWSGWVPLGVYFSGHPVAARNADKRIEVFMRAANGALLHIWQTAPNNGWSGWASLGGVLTSELAVTNNKDGRLEVFGRGTDSALWHIWQTAPNNGWSGWASLGGVITSDPAVCANKDGRLEAFARGTDGACWHLYQVQANGAWSGWSSLGGVIVGDQAVTGNADGRVELMVRGSDLALWHRWQTAPNNGWN